MVLIYYLSSKSSLPSPIDLPFIDKFYHFLEYLILGFLLLLTGISKILLVFIGILYAGLDEIHQIFISGRDPSFWDWTFDFLGILTGIYGVDYWKKKKS